MSEPDFSRVRSVFMAARDVDDARRGELLDRECRDDATLRAEVQSLLDHHDRDSNIGHELDERLKIAVHDSCDLIVEGQPPLRQFDRYEILDILGRGGMGIVYRARQENPDRIVALKVINPGMATPAVMRRFDLETRLLGRLQHPGIAQIFEAGTTDAGAGVQPYFAMELVDGRPITTHADERSLGTRERIRLLIRVCDAVHHAHQKGIIHRDIKPANVLVDARGQPKVLDFGVARATDADVATATMRTNVGQLIGTLPYMSPEQVAGDPTALDLRSDLYALGILAFELLTGRLPYDVENRSVPEAARVITDVRPSRLSSFNSVFRGDLETIIDKALEKEPERRYPSAAALSDDLSRFLDHQPIEARPPSMTYKLRLLARRHRAFVAAALLVMVGLLAATIVSTVSAVRANIAAVREASQREVAEGIIAQLEQMLLTASPHESGQEVTVIAMLDQTIARIEADSSVPPEVEAAIRHAAGRTYKLLMRFAQAETQLRRAVTLYREIDPLDWRTARALQHLGGALGVTGREFAAEAAYSQAYAIAVERPDDRIPLRGIMIDLSESLTNRGKSEEAEPILLELLASLRSDGAPPADMAIVLRKLGHTYHRRAQQATAEGYLREALEQARKAFPEAHPIIQATLEHLALVMQAQGNHEAAREIRGETWRMAQRVRPLGSTDWIYAYRQYVFALCELDEEDEAESVMRSVIMTLESELGAEDERVVDARRFLGVLYRTWGQSEKAASMD